MILMLLNDASDAAAIKAEHDRLRAIDKEREKKHNQKFRGSCDVFTRRYIRT